MSRPRSNTRTRVFPNGRSRNGEPMPRSNVVILSLLVIAGAMSIPACAKKKGGSPEADPTYVTASQSLEKLKADARKLQAETAAIHKRLERLDTLADDLPGVPAFRSNLFATEE